mgnify:FL=1
MSGRARYAGTVPESSGRQVSPYSVEVIDCDGAPVCKHEERCRTCTDRYPYAIVVREGKTTHYLSHGLSDARADDLRALARLAFSIGLELGRKEPKP